MKRITTFLLLILINFTYSQSVDLDPHSFNLSYVTLPPKPVLERKNRTYSMLVDTGNVPEFKDAKDHLEYNVSIDGFKNVSTNGYFVVDVNLWNPMIILQEIRKNEYKSKDDKGVEKISISYTVIYKVREMGSFSIKCEGDASFNKKYSLEKTYTVENSFVNYEDAKNFPGLSVVSVRNAYLRSVVSDMDYRLNHDYGFVVEQTSDYLWILDSKKHPEFDSNVKALSNVKAVFNKMSYNEDVAPLKAELESTIKYFEGVDKTYVEDERRQRKLRYGAYFNLAAIYHYLDMPDESDIWCDKLIENKYDVTDGKTMKLKNENLREIFAVNQIKTRHIDVEVRSNGVKEEEVDVANFDPNYFLKNDPKYQLVSLVLTTNDTVSGYAKIRAIENLDRKIAVSIPDENGNHNHIFKTYFADQVTKLILQENDFYSTVSFKEAIRASAKPVFRFVRELLNGKTISLYGYLNSEIIVKKQGEEWGASTNSLGWQMNTKSKFVELARPCPKLVARANGTEFKNDLNSFRKFVEALDACN
ncbi:hypothetical protein [Flavobacterium branchiicola]|uniref:Uncharacterized protein n=1 Tax=Flavobacterium branchiicola TaxID=1114875 RepID=A0ABV9PJF3_9FLAO|nr:hypothetical protein [Flavobacterium branchiicola]MBS7256268.1 hypothetical protein [Flavobacterium branchiicola]